MSAKSNVALTAEIISVITGQTTPKSITPITHGALEKNIVDSMYNNIDTPLNRTQTFADVTARAAAVPEFIGQKGTQLDTNTDYISTGLVAGNWRLPANTQIQSDTYAIAGGTNAYSITLAPVLLAYAAGNSFKVLFTNANTTAASLNINTLGAVPIKKNTNVALAGGDIKAGGIYILTFDGTNFQLTAGAGTSLQSGTGTISPAGMTGGSTLMMGLAIDATTTKTGTIFITIDGEYTTNTNSQETDFYLVFGTGVAPSNGAAFTGTATKIFKRTSPDISVKNSFSFTYVLSFGSIGARWIDLGLNNQASGAVQLYNVSYALIEQ